jgi:hypothetical protein
MDARYSKNHPKLNICGLYAADLLSSSYKIQEEQLMQNKVANIVPAVHTL